jgi:hypothetical protein
MLSEGLKVTLSEGVPAPGTVVGVVHANVPGTEAVPPVKVEDASVWPYVMALAVGHAEIVGTAWFTVKVTEPEMVPDVALMVAPPGATPVAMPVLLMVATAVLEELQVTELVRFCVVPLL